MCGALEAEDKLYAYCRVCVCVCVSADCQVADQPGAMFGQCAFNVGDVKCTMGTGTFIDCNTGNKPHASISGEQKNKYKN